MSRKAICNCLVPRVDQPDYLHARESVCVCVCVCVCAYETNSNSGSAHIEHVLTLINVSARLI